MLRGMQQKTRGLVILMPKFSTSGSAYIHAKTQQYCMHKIRVIVDRHYHGIQQQVSVFHAT